MSQTVTLGGDRIGSGNKMKEELHDYGMTSFNLEQDFKSSLAPGVLYPFLKLVGTNHDSFDIDLDSFVRTIPTQGPLFGSFKLQADIYMCPIRLYQGILHNNPVGIGLKMNQVFLPKIKYVTKDIVREGANKYNRQIADNALEKYLGISGAGRAAAPETSTNIVRKFQCVPELAYYDIFKCYYANKQEEKAYVIGLDETSPIKYGVVQFGYDSYTLNDEEVEIDKSEDVGYLVVKTTSDTGVYGYPDILNLNRNAQLTIYCEDEFGTAIFNEKHTFAEWQSASQYVSLSGETKTMLGLLSTIPSLPGYVYYLDMQGMKNAIQYFGGNLEELVGSWYLGIECGPSAAWTITDGVKDVQLIPFDLKNIDTMRNRILSNNQLGQEFVIDNTTNLLPYSVLVNTTSEGVSWNAYEMNGLVVKTYQSDLFNNWLDTEFIDGEQGIANITAVAVTDGKFLLDSVNFAEKMYNLLNRILVSGGTYQDWQEARWGEGATRMAESPIFVGGMSAEVMFEEVIATTEANEEQPLGALGGKGTQVGKKGGNHIHVKCDEPCYIIGILSLTPRISYSQGNDWDRTELDTLNDLHAPEMDGIGFQDLMTEQMAWFDNQIDSTGQLTRHSAGKQTAWINYQTAVDKCYGDFAKVEGYAFMVLNRNYSINESTGGLADLTTYIDPAKYNYAFAVTDLTAQNFWVQIHSKVIARRKMGGQQIPTM